MVTKDSFGSYEKYLLASEELELWVATLGATCLSLKYRGRELLIGYRTPEEYASHNTFAGNIVGRFANRIKNASFALNGREYKLAANEKKNQLHGGPAGFHTRRWTAEVTGDAAVRFTYFSPDGENGYPGNLRAAVTYTVDGAKLRIDFEGESDEDTIYSPTTHMIFNLDGSESVLGTQLRLPASSYLETDAELIPTKKRPCVKDFDFREPRTIGQTYDHCFIIDPDFLPGVAVAEAGGVRMSLRTDFPALQLYTGQYLSVPHHPLQGFALEPEGYPDSPNRPDFPSPVLRKEAHYHKYAEYLFETV